MPLVSRRVARLHLRSTVDGVQHADVERECLTGDGEVGLAGMGWGFWENRDLELEFDEYSKQHSGPVDDSVQRLHDLPVGSLIWTRSTDSLFWIGELVGPWRYAEDARARRLDLFCTRPCRWWRLGPEDAVPGKIINNFRPAKTLNPVADHVAVRFSNQVHARLAGSAPPVQTPTATEVITSLLAPGDLEDLVAVFLQDRHDLLLVARGATTRGYEYVLRHRETGRKAVCTVKSGASPVDPSTLPDDPQVDLWAYAVSGDYGLEGVREMRTISTDDLAAFVDDRRSVLPDRVTWWLS